MLIVTKITDESNQTVGFTTEYPDNEYIIKTTVYGFDIDSNLDITNPGKITVFMRNGEQYTFECWADSVYCGQFGINVSKNGMYIYIISDEVGLWCYKYTGEIVWKTRYTTVGHVIINDNETITCITSNKLIILNKNGKTVKQKNICHYHAERASENFVYAAVNNSIMALIDSETLDILWQSSLKNLGMEKSRWAVMYDKYLIISGYGENGNSIILSVKMSDNICEKCKYDKKLLEYNGFNSYIKTITELL